MALFPSPRIRLHEVFVRAKAVTTTLSIYEDGLRVVPSSATFTLEKPDGTEQISSESATISGGGELSYAVSAGQIPASLNLSDSYLIRWTVVISGVEYTFSRPCAVALSRLYPVITDLDLEAIYSDISSIRSSTLTSYQGFITESFIQIIQRLRDQGNFEYLIMDPQSLRSSHLDLCFYLIWKDMDSSGLGEGRYLDLAKEHRYQFEAHWKRLKFRYDLDQDNHLEGDDLRSAQPVIYTSNPPQHYWRRW